MIDIKQLYEKQLYSIRGISRLLGVSRTTVMKLLQARRVDTSKRLRKVKCSYCGKILYRPRSHVKKQLHFFCSPIEFSLFQKNPATRAVMEGQRKGRAVLQEIVGIKFRFPLVIYHVDRDIINNKPENLWGFRSMTDFRKFIHGGRVRALKGITGKWRMVKK